MITIDTKTIAQLAKLAAIQLTDDEKKSIQDDLEKILTHVSTLEEVVTPDVTPLWQVTGLQHVVREDVVVQDPYHKALLAAMPEKKDGYLVVPPVFRGESPSH